LRVLAFSFHFAFNGKAFLISFLPTTLYFIHQGNIFINNFFFFSSIS
jgi:hypothetical protein